MSPVYYLDPNADFKAGWTEVPSGAAFSTVDDGTRQPAIPSATDRIESSTSSNNCTLDLSTFTIPATESITQLKAWAYCTVPSTNHQVALNMMVTAGTTGSSASSLIQATGWASNTWTGRSFSQTEINSLRLQLVLTEFATEAGLSTVTGCYVEVTTVSTVGPYYAAVMATSPALYWRLDDTGSTAADASGNGRTGTYVGDVTHGEPGLVPTDSSPCAFIDVGKRAGDIGSYVPISGVVANSYKPWTVGSKRSFAMWLKTVDRTAERYEDGLPAITNGLGAPTLVAGDSHLPGSQAGAPHPTWEMIDSRNGTVRMYGTVNHYPTGWTDIVHSWHHGDLVHYVSTFDDVTGIRRDYVDGQPAGEVGEGYLPEPQNEIQRFSITGATSGTFTLTFSGQTTAAISRTATSGAVQTALVALSNIGPGDVIVSGGPVGTDNLLVEYAGALGISNQPLLVVNTGGLGGSPVATVTTVQGGIPDLAPIIPHFDKIDDPGHLTLGYRDQPPGITETYAGWMDEFALWERLLTDAEVAALYDAGVGTAPPPPPGISGERATPPLELGGEVLNRDGQGIAWGADAKAAYQMQNVSFSTARGDGFKTCSITLSRDAGIDWPDLQLYNDVTLFGLDGEVAWQGRIAGLPREVIGQSSITVECVGWMAHARDAKFREIYVHRDLSAWGPASTTLKLYWITGHLSPQDASVVPDNSGYPCLQCETTAPWTELAKPMMAAWFDSGGIPLGGIYYAWRKSLTVDHTNTLWDWRVTLDDTDLHGVGSYDDSGNLRALGPSSGTLSGTTDTRFFAALHVLYNAGPSDTGGDWNTRYDVNWNVLAVYGNHSLPKRSNADDDPYKDAPGFFVSDLIRDIVNRFAPLLNPFGVADSTLVVPHASYMEPTDPLDAIIELNNLHNYGLEVWEDRVLHWQPVDLTEADWHVRTDDQNLTVSLQGDTADDVANGIIVRYTDFLGRSRTLTPDTHSQLRATDPNLPATLASLKVWTNVDVPFPTTEAVALNIGNAALAEFNRPKAPGTISVRGHIRDVTDNWAQVWKVRAGQSVAITDFANDKPRLITETNYDHSSNTMTITVDGTARTLDAWFERVQGAIKARGL